MNTKVVKRMEAFRVRSLTRGSTRRILLPLSLGPSSTSLLHILSDHLDGQTSKSGRTGYCLHVVHVSNEESSTLMGDSLSPFRKRYSNHEYSTISLQDDVESDAIHQGQVNGRDQASNQRLDLQALISSTTSSSSRRDLSNICLRNKLVAYAQELGCEAIVWGDTTTSLAEKILSETAKGRGSSLAWVTNDGESPLGIPFYFPMRDLLRKELSPFVGTAGIALGNRNSEESKSAPASAKNATIDGLMQEYFESVEENYPSIVANVVRTSSKLRAPKVDPDTARCDCCEMPVQSAQEHAEVGSDTAAAAVPDAFLCHGCHQSLRSSA